MSVLLVYVQQREVATYNMIDRSVGLLVGIVGEVHKLHLNCFSDVIIHGWVTEREFLSRGGFHVEKQ